MTTPSDPHSTDHNAIEHNATEQSYPNYPSYPQQDVNPAEAQQEKQGSKKKRVVGYSVGAVILVVIIVVCALVFGKGTTSAKTADGLAEGLQANLRDGTGISEYLCEAPAQPLKYGALTPHLEGVMADETEQSQESADLQPFIDDMLKALSDNPNAEVKVAKKEDSKAIIVYNFHADDIKDKISDKSLSGIHMSREEGNHAIEEMTADRHTITYHAEKQDDKWCVQDR